MKNFFSCLLVVTFLWGGVFSVNAQDTRTTSISLTSSEVSSYPLSVSDVMPGDTISQEITVNVTHNNNSEIKLKYVADEDAFQPLLDAFSVSIYIAELDKTVYSGALEDVSVEDLFVQYSTGERAIHYTFTFYMDEEAGNECANQTLAGVFVWSCESVGTIPAYGDVITSPQTGENVMFLQCVVCIMLVTLVVVFLLLYKKKRRQHG